MTDVSFGLMDGEDIFQNVLSLDLADFSTMEGEQVEQGQVLR